MKLRIFTLLGVAGLSILTAAAGYTANKLDIATDQLAADKIESQDCMADGFETPEGIVGCFTPVIAIIDESFFALDDESAEDGNIAE